MNILIGMVGVFSFILGLLYAFLGMSPQGTALELSAAGLYFIAALFAIPPISDRLMHRLGLRAAPAFKVRVLILLFLAAGAMAFFGGRTFGERLERQSEEPVEQLEEDVFEDVTPSRPKDDASEKGTDAPTDTQLPPAAPEAVEDHPQEADV